MSSVMRFSIVLVLLLAVPLEAVTVSTLCPTNKIAPHRRVGSWQNSRFRTIGAFYHLLAPNAPQFNYQDELQEQPQEDDPDDCGEIEDYDENDISSHKILREKKNTNFIVQPTKNRNERDDSRFFFGDNIHRPPHHNPVNRPPRPPPTTNRPVTRPPRPQQPVYPPYSPQQPSYPPQGPPPYQPPQPIYPPQGPQPIYPQRPPQTNYPPQRPQRPNRPPQRPPYWSGGVFGNNHYQSPQYQNPSNNIKPVHETAEDYANAPLNSYRPGVVGGSLGQVVGVTQVRPTVPSQENQRTTELYNTNLHSTEATIYSTRRPRTRKPNNNDSVIGSFIDLLF